MSLFPYLNLGTTTRQAFTRYQEIFGGELVLLRMADMPDGELPPGADPELIMHAALKFGDDLLMASDTGDPAFAPVHGMYVNWTTPDPADAERVFAALCDGGDVEMPLQATFWAPAFGVCRDRFGIQWMIAAESSDTAGS